MQLTFRAGDNYGNNFSDHQAHGQDPEGEQPTHLGDLNEPLPEEFHDRYDLVLDDGTAEHCFNVKEVFSNVIRAMKPSGRLIQVLPISGFADHGFYQFSPTFFYDFYGTSGFDEMEMKIDLRMGLKNFYFNHPRNAPLPGDFWGIPAMAFFTARKAREVGKIRMPIQSIFELPLDYELRCEKKESSLVRMAKAYLPDVLKKYLLRRLFFARTNLYPL